MAKRKSDEPFASIERPTHGGSYVVADGALDRREFTRPAGEDAADEEPSEDPTETPLAPTGPADGGEAAS